MMAISSPQRRSRELKGDSVGDSVGKWISPTASHLHRKRHHRRSRFINPRAIWLTKSDIFRVREDRSVQKPPGFLRHPSNQFLRSAQILWRSQLVRTRLKEGDLLRTRT